MRINTTTEVLVTALRSHVVEKRTPIPVLSYARIKGDTVITTDLDITCIATIQGGTMSGKPDFLIPAKRVVDLIEGQTGPLTLEFVEQGADDTDGASNNRHVKLSHGNCTFKLGTMPIANFPTVPDIPLLTFEFDGASFKRMIDHVLFSISAEESRYTLNGALLRVVDGKVHMIATDGHRMSLLEDDSDAPKLSDTLIPRSVLRWIQNNIGDRVVFGFGVDCHAVKTGDATLIFHKMPGQFPNYQAVIPAPDKIMLTATIPSVRELRDTLRRVAMCADPRSMCVRWEFGSETRISAKCEERGSASAVIDCTVDGELALAWNADCIMDLMGIIDDGPMTIAMTDAQSAGLFTLDGMRYIAMPMRTF